jgi:hypothetical protein
MPAPILAAITPWKCDPPKTTALKAVSGVQATDVLVGPASSNAVDAAQAQPGAGSNGRKQRQSRPTWNRRRKRALHTPDGTADRAGSAGGVRQAPREHHLSRRVRRPDLLSLRVRRVPDKCCSVDVEPVVAQRITPRCPIL